jgi:tetratricopeptide (TPR) repeat protein/SOS-response transcriptional repressor LexA
MAHQPLTADQRSFLRILLRLQRKNGAPPTIRELQTAGRFKSPRSVTQFLEALETAGYISRREGARNIRVLRVDGASASESKRSASARPAESLPLESLFAPQDLGQWQHPPPSEWEKFERICFDLWKHIWKDDNTRRHGRGGQVQDGVDIFGQIEGKGWAGLQCKKREAFAADALTVEELPEIVEAAKAFKPKLALFVIAYTGRSDKKVQEAARLITDRHRHLRLFEVHVSSWDDIVACAGDHPAVFIKHFPNSSNIDVAALSRRLSDITSAVREDIPQMLAEIRNDDLSGVVSTAAQSVADIAVLEEHNSELDHAKALIEQFKHKEALDFLEPLEKRIFTRARPLIRYRLLSNKAAAKAGLGALEEAGQLFVQAHQYNPDDEKALCNRAVGHLFLRQLAEAAGFARRVIERNPLNTRAHEILVRCAPPTEPFDAILESIPGALRESEDVAHALSQAARERGDMELAIRWLEVSLSKSNGKAPGIQADLGSTILETFIRRGEVLNGLQVKPEDRARLERCVSVLSQALAGLAASGNLEQLVALLVNRSTAHDCLGEQRKALADIEKALELAPEDPKVLKQKAFLLHKAGETNAAVGLLRTILTNPRVPEAALILSQVLYDKGDRTGAASILERSIADRSAGQLKDAERRFLGHVLLTEGDLDGARRLSAQMRAEAPTDVLTLVDAAKIERVTGDAGTASALLEEALQYVSDATPFQHVIALGNALYSTERFADACRVYERVVDPRVDSPFAERLLYAYYRAGETEKALEACHARPAKDKRLATQIELSILEDIGDLEGAVAITSTYLALHPEDLELRARLAWLLFRLVRMSELDELLALPIDPGSAPIDAGFRLASMLAERGQHARCIDLAYELRRRHFDNGEAHMKYVGLFFGRSKELDTILESDVVAKDFAVRVQEDGQESRWYILEDRADATAARDELDIRTGLAKRLLGRRLNDEMVTVGSVSESRLKIAEIKSKFVFALHESLELLPNRFAETKGFEKIPVPDGAVRETFEKILDAASIRGQDASQAQKLYVDLKITIGTLANMIDKGAIEVWDGLVGSRWGVRSCLGTPQERGTALATLKRDSAVVVDITALLTAADVGVLELLKSTFKECLLTQSTVDLILAALTELSGKQSEGFMIGYKEGEDYYRREVTADQIQSYLARLERLKVWVKENCRVVPVKGVAKLGQERRSKLEKLVGKAFLESMLAAQENSCPLYSDDFGTRSFASEEFGVSGFWTQILVMGAVEAEMAPRELADKVAVDLVLRNHKHTTINGSTLLEAARRSGWTADEAFSRIVGALGDPRTEFRSALVVVADFAAQLWSEPILDLRREGLLRAALDAIAEQRNSGEIVRAIVPMFTQRFKLNPLVGNRVIRILSAWRSLKLR